MVGFLTLAVLLFGLGRFTWKEAAHYRDAETLWRATLEENPHAVAAHSNLGIVLHNRGAIDESVTWYREALRIMPGYSSANDNLGRALRQKW